MHGTPHIVSDVMTHTVAAVGRGATVKEIVQLMQDWKISALPVIEGEGRVVGVVSEADLLPKEEFRDSDPQLRSAGGTPTARLRRLSDLAKAGAVTAEELMTSPVLTVRPDATLAQAARTMARAKVKRLPVVDAVGLLEGVVSRGDLLKIFLRTDDEIAEEVRREVVSPCSPRRTRASAWTCWTASSSSSARYGTPRWCRSQHGWSGPSRASWTWTSTSPATASRPSRRARPHQAARASVLHEPAGNSGLHEPAGDSGRRQNGAARPRRVQRRSWPARPRDRPRPRRRGSLTGIRHA